MSYIDTIKEKARADRKTIVLPETNDKRTLIAAAHVLHEGIANIIMVGNEEKIMDGAGWLEVDLTGVTVIDPSKTDKLDEYVELLYETRKAKGMTVEKAREIMEGNKDLFIKDVASMVGFADQFYFSRIFRSVTGVSPAEYLKEKKTNLTEL